MYVKERIELLGAVSGERPSVGRVAEADGEFQSEVRVVRAICARNQSQPTCVRTNTRGCAHDGAQRRRQPGDPAETSGPR